MLLGRHDDEGATVGATVILFCSLFLCKPMLEMTVVVGSEFTLFPSSLSSAAIASYLFILNSQQTKREPAQAMMSIQS